MMIKVAILLGFGIVLVLLAVRRLRHYRLKERYTLLFFACALPFLGLAVWPGAIGWLAIKLDIHYAIVALMCVSSFFILMIFELLTIVSTQDRRINTLAQIVGVMMEKHGMSDRDPGARVPHAGDANTRRSPVDGLRMLDEKTRTSVADPYEKVR